MNFSIDVPILKIQCILNQFLEYATVLACYRKYILFDKARKEIP